MEDSTPGVNKSYIIGVSILTFVLPVVSAYIEMYIRHEGAWFELAGKWFIFYAVGIRLLLAGIRQISHPAFTAREIFHIESDQVLPIVRELGFANLCAGLVGMAALMLPQWRIVSAFSSGLYYGIAGVYHLVKKPAGINEQFAMVSDIIIFLLLAVYTVVMF